MGHFRIGFFKPTLALALVSEQLPFMASLILPIFLLAPLFLLFVRREVNPLKEVNARLTTMLRDTKPGSGVEQTKSDDLRGVIEQFNQFLTHAKGQISEYQDEKSKLVTSGKFLSYRLHRFEAILNSVPDGVLVVDDEACVSFANLRVRSLLSLQPEDLLGAKVSACVQDPALMAHFAKHETNLGRLVGEALVFNPQNQPDISVSAAVHRLNDGDEGSSHHYLVIFRDVSSEARAQQSRSEFVAHLAHELKNPLHTLAMYAEALQDEGDKPEEFQLEAVNVISDEVERLARLINNLLSMTQIEMGTLQLDRQRIKLVDLVRDTTETMERSARGRELTFEMDLPNDVIPVHVDKDLLRIAVNNLLTNAIKYTDPGGTINVSVSESDEAVSICVADTGIGIAEDDQAQIFQKFFRAGGDDMKSRSGHGLGLPLARDIVEMHHGSIRVESEPGQGSRFTIDLWKHAGVMQQAI
jgi:two-component system sensor histidine kinase VicK